MSGLPEKWEVVRIWCAHLHQPHDKFCITIDAEAGLYFFINSDPPPFRKARAVAVEIDNYEATFLHHNSFVDTTSPEDFSPGDVAKAYKDESRRHGFLIKTVRTRIVAAAKSHGVLSPAQLKAIVGD